MTEPNTQSNRGLEFGKACMYVIAEDGLQREPLINHNKPTIGYKETSRKNVTFSRTRAIDFSWKQIANRTKRSSKLRVLNLNESLRVDVDAKRNVKYDTRIQCYAGVKKPKEYLNQPSVCLNAAGVHHLRQTTNENEKVPCFASSRCSLSINGFQKGTGIRSGKVAERKSRKYNDETREYLIYPENCYSENKRLPCDRCTNSLSCENEASGISKKLIRGDQDDSGNCNLIRNIASGKKTESSGKYYLKRIFYSKAKNYTKPGKPECLPQIRKTTGNQSGRTGSKTTETKEQTRADYERNLLPLNISVSEDSKKQKHHFKSIIKLPTVVDKRTGQLHLAIEAIAFERSDYNKWSRRQKRITPGNAKPTSSFPFPLINKDIR